VYAVCFHVKIILNYSDIWATFSTNKFTKKLILLKY